MSQGVPEGGRGYKKLPRIKPRWARKYGKCHTPSVNMNNSGHAPAHLGPLSEAYMSCGVPTSIPKYETCVMATHSKPLMPTRPLTGHVMDRGRCHQSKPKPANGKAAGAWARATRARTRVRARGQTRARSPARAIPKFTQPPCP